MGAELTRVAIVEDHPVFRRGLSQLIEDLPTMTMVLASASIEDFERQAPRQPTVVLLDLHLPGVEGPEAIRHLCAQGHAVLVLSATGSGEAILDAMAAGASGYLTKVAEASQIEAAITAVAGGRTFVSPTAASYLLQAAKSDERVSQVKLSEREKEVLTLLAQGERDCDIAQALFIGLRTVHSHLERIRNKTGLRRRADLTRLAIEQGLTPSTGKGSDRGWQPP